MKNPLLHFLIIFIFTLICLPLHAQICGQLNIQETANIQSDCNHITMTMLHDQQGRNYLYVAAKEGGLRIYDINIISSPMLIGTIGVAQFDQLQVMNISQNGNYLYLALGNFFSGDQNPGLAIIDVTDPTAAELTDFWKFNVASSGAGIVEVEGDYAYLGAMGHGLIVLNVSDKNNITFVSQFEPDLLFPEPNPDPAKYNARGMAVRDDVVYLCFDAGGLRIIDVSNKFEPKESGRYSNPAMNGRPRAYNNIVLKGSLAYVAVDYCGMEVLDISDASNIKLHSWWNPWDCTSSLLAWFGSAGHANEIVMDAQNDLIFLSTGKSDMHVVDVSDPAFPDSCGIYGGVDNGIGSWGIDVFGDKIFISYICAFIPFPSNYSGVKILSYDRPTMTNVSNAKKHDIACYPNPATVFIYLHGTNLQHSIVEFFNSKGELLARLDDLETHAPILLPSNYQGIVFYKLTTADGKIYSGRFIKHGI